jgi:hypothetical protein
MNLQEDQKAILETILQLTYKIESDKSLKEDLKSAIKHSDTIPLSGDIKSVLFQIACLYDVFESDCHSCKDLHPELSDDNKKDILRTALTDVLKDQRKEFHRLYTVSIDYVYYGNEKIEVTEICREGFVYILFKAKGKNEYYLDFVRNNSSAYWSETRKIDEAAAKSLIADPGFENVRSIFYEFGK